MTVDELAQRAATTTRNVRHYQTIGILAPPRLVGRVGHYDDGHLARLRLVSRLQEKGFSLAGIAGLVQAWEQGRSLADVLGFEQALTGPWSDEEPEAISLEALVALFPEAVSDPRLGFSAVEQDLVEPDEDHFRVPSPSLLRAGADLVAAGVPLGATLDEVAVLRADMDRIATRFVAMFDRWVWQPFLEAGMPAERLPEVTDSLRRLRPLAGVVVNALLAQAMERQTAARTAGRASTATESTTESSTETATETVTEAATEPTIREVAG
ncbi:MerR family transcriptional regulator [soil metagenome]